MGRKNRRPQQKTKQRAKPTDKRENQHVNWHALKDSHHQFAAKVLAAVPFELVGAQFYIDQQEQGSSHEQTVIAAVRKLAAELRELRARNKTYD